MITGDNFVIIVSSMSAVSGVLLAASLSLAFFFARHIADWRDRLVTQLVRNRGILQEQMEKSAEMHPEISQRLVDIYMLAVSYIPGQAIETSDVYRADAKFSQWEKEIARGIQERFSFDDLNTYNTFAKHIFDAHVNIRELRETLIELSVVEKSGRSITTFIPLIITFIFDSLLSRIEHFLN